MVLPFFSEWIYVCEIKILSQCFKFFIWKKKQVWTFVEKKWPWGRIYSKIQGNFLSSLFQDSFKFLSSYFFFKFLSSFFQVSFKFPSNFLFKVSFYHIFINLQIYIKVFIHFTIFQQVWIWLPPTTFLH